MSDASGILTAIPQHYVTDYDDAWRIALQQEEHILAGTYQEKQIDGKEGRFDYMGPAAAMRARTSRNGFIQPRDMTMFSRWVRPVPYDNENIIDQFDAIALGKLGDPTSAIVKNQALSANRTKDALVAAGLLGTAYIGESGTTPVTLPNTQIVAVNYVRKGSAVNSGMTLAKILKAKQILDANQVPMSDRYLALGSTQMADLLNDVDQISNDRYVDVKALIEGKPGKFAGFEFKLNCDGFLPLSASSIRGCIAWHKAGVGMGHGMNVSASIDILPERRHSILCMTTLLESATRLEEGRVVEILCDETL